MTETIPDFYHTKPFVIDLGNSDDFGEPKDIIDMGTMGILVTWQAKGPYLQYGVFSKNTGWNISREPGKIFRSRLRNLPLEDFNYNVPFRIIVDGQKRKPTAFRINENRNLLVNWRSPRNQYLSVEFNPITGKSVNSALGYYLKNIDFVTVVEVQDEYGLPKLIMSEKSLPPVPGRKRHMTLDEFKKFQRLYYSTYDSISHTVDRGEYKLRDMLSEKDKPVDDHPF